MLSILVVDDNAYDRRLAIRELEKEFHPIQIHEISNMQSFKTALETVRFDLVVTDYQLQWNDGLKILELTKERYPDCPVVMFTSSASQEIAVEAMKAGLDDYVVKSPKNYTRLAITVRRTLERTEAQRNAKGLEVRLQTLLNQLNVGVYRLTSTGELLEGNAAFLRLLGLNSLNELPANQTLEVYFQADDYAELLRQLQQNGEVREREIQLQRADGSRCWVKITKSFTRYKEFKIIDGLIEDISDRKASEQEREQLLYQEQIARQEAELQKRRLLFFAEASRLLTATLDYQNALVNVARLVVSAWADWCFIDVMEPNSVDFHPSIVAAFDPEQESLLHSLRNSYQPSADSSVGIPKVLNTGEPELAEVVSDKLLAAFAQTESHFDQIRQLHPQSYMIVPLIARDTKLGVMTFVSCRLEQRYNSTDLNLAIELAQRIALAIDNARLYQEAQQANRLKDEFLAIVSHELRTPLNSILGWARMLKRGQVNEAIFKRAIETIERNANAQNRLINDLLDISRITQNRLNLELEPLDLIPIIDAVIEALHPIAEAKSIRIETQLDPSSKQVMGDAERLQQVIWNLLTNAIKFTPSQGRIGVELRYQPSDRTSSVAYAQLLVADTGQGISAEFLPHVFERFRQEETSTTQTQSGLGLGLAIVRHIVEMHHGSVDVTSEGIGQGSIFTVRLPLLQ